MTPLPRSLTQFLEEPVFALTADQDWAPEWAVAAFLKEVGHFQIPLHFFRTNPSAAVDRSIGPGAAEQGWHPNFLPGSTQGDSVPEIIRYCQRHFPGASTVRSHCFAEDSFAWRELRAAGIVADSQFASLFQGYLLPSIHWTGILRLPVYFGDDIFFDLAGGDLNLEAILPTLFTPGLKILSFHPTFIACNTPSRTYHEARKSRIFARDSTAAGLVWDGRGTGNVFRELVGCILSRGHRFQRFHAIVDRAGAAFAGDAAVVPPWLAKVPTA